MEPHQVTDPVLDEEELSKAVWTLGRSLDDPAQLALENAAMRSAIQGSYALIRVLVRRSGGSVIISREELMATPGKVDVEDKGDTIRITLA